MEFLQTVTTQIDWVPYGLGALGALVMLFGGAAVSDLKQRVKDLEEENKKNSEERVKRNEAIAREISDWKLSTKDDLNDIKNDLSRILK